MANKPKAQSLKPKTSVEDWKYGRLEVITSLTAILIHNRQQSTLPAGRQASTVNRQLK